jgi:ATP-binding protein involved in chromosome partitioning
MGDLTINKEKILQALSTVQEPDLKKDLVTLGMIRDVETGLDSVSFTVVLTTPACPHKELIRKDCTNAIHTFFGTHIRVNINLTSDVTTSRTGGPVVPQVKNIIAVASGKGGVGKSTVTANLAMALYRSGAKVGILDADIYGPSMPVMFGAEDMQPRIVSRDGKNRMVPVQQWGIKLISMGFLVPADSATVWRGPMASTALRQLIGDVEWGELDYLLIDLPPGTGDAQITIIQESPICGVLLVTTPQQVAVSDVRRSVHMFRRAGVPVLGIVENMSYFCAPSGEPLYFFGQGGGQQLATELQAPLLGQIPLDPQVCIGGDQGQPLTLTQPDSTVATVIQQIAQGLVATFDGDRQLNHSIASTTAVL